MLLNFTDTVKANELKFLSFCKCDNKLIKFTLIKDVRSFIAVTATPVRSSQLSKNLPSPTASNSKILN